MRPLIVIPARLKSVRFPEKPLAQIEGKNGNRKSLIERTWNAAIAYEDADHIVATDAETIADEVRQFGGRVMMTPESCRNGTERCAALVAQLDYRPEFVINLQGDSPLVPVGLLAALVDNFRSLKDKPSLLTPVIACDATSADHMRRAQRAGQPLATTAAIDDQMNALYFSREVLPSAGPTYAHIGLYAYSVESLHHYATLPPAKLEMAEGLEQLRFIENGMAVKCFTYEGPETDMPEVNYPSDIDRVEAALRQG